MKERPILFSAPMVRALLNGSKTQTRRVAKLTDAAHVKEPRGHRRWHPADPEARLACPYGQPGDQLWVRETFQPTFAPGVEHGAADWSTGEGYQPLYMATDKRVEWIDADDNITDRCKPAIHMPRWASRITLELTGVRVERLQDISEADAISEGLYQDKAGRWTTYSASKDAREHLSAVEAYRDLWESINGPGSWDKNPWVWVVEFTRHNAGIQRASPASGEAPLE